MDGSGSSSARSSSGFEDVEEFLWANEGETSMSSDRFNQVFDLMQRGNRAFRENRFEDAINCYSKANNFKPGDSVILSNRSAAFSRMSQFLRNRSPSAIEYSPLDGLDPTTHAELALKDAKRVMSCRSNSAKSYFLKANALILLEQYEEARDTLLSGLQVDPLSNPLHVSLRDLERISSNLITRTKHGKPQCTDDFDCTLCLKLLYEPITTPCGHSFCRSCLFQAMDHGDKCPMCRTVLFITPRTYSISVTLSNIIQKNFPEEYAERKSEHDNLTNLGVDLMPLFVMDVVLPCQKLLLNIFEPRYRLMVRRIMEGNRRMGMVVIDSTSGSIADFACEVEITECEPLPDGRFYLEVEGRRRFRILRSWDQDGYRVAEVEWIRDIYPQEGTRERQDLQEIVSDATDFAHSWIRRAKEAAQTAKSGRTALTIYPFYCNMFIVHFGVHDSELNADRRLRRMELLQAEGMPTPDDPERFSFWLVNLSNRRPSDRLALLRLRDTKERIQRGLIYLRAE